MESQPESKPAWLEQPFIKTLAVGLLVIVGIALFLLLTRGSQFCVLSAICTQAPPHASVISPGGTAVAAVAAVALVTVFEVPVLAAVGIAVVIGLIIGQFF